MRMMPTILVGLAILAYAFTRVPDRSKPARSQRLKWLQKLAGVVAVILAVLIVINPEFLALGLLGDAAFFDLFVLLISLQLQTAGTRAWSRVVALLSRFGSWVMAPRMRLRTSSLLIVSASIAFESVVSTIQKVVHRLSS